MIEGKPRCAALTCLCTILFVYYASAYADQSPVSLLLHLKLIEVGGYVAVLLVYYGVSNKVALYCCMRRFFVSSLARVMTCCLFGSRPSSESMMVYHYLDSLLESDDFKQITTIFMRERIEMSPANGGLSAAASMGYWVPTSGYTCVVTETPYLHRNIVVWNCMFFNLDATLGRWDRRGDCQVDDGVPVVVNSTAIGAAPGALTVAAGAYPFKSIIYRVITTCLLCIHTWYAVASSITFFSDILLNGLYLYLWLYVDSCFTPCKISVNKILLLYTTVVIPLLIKSCIVFRRNRLYLSSCVC